jgi:hypothetical protein
MVNWEQKSHVIDIKFVIHPCMITPELQIVREAAASPPYDPLQHRIDGGDSNGCRL